MIKLVSLQTNTVSSFERNQNQTYNNSSVVPHFYSLGYRFDDHVSCNVVKAPVLSLGFSFRWPSEALKERRVKDFWHFARHHHQFAVWVPPTGKRGRGRPQLRLLDVVANDEGVSAAQIRRKLERALMDDDCSLRRNPGRLGVE